MTGRRKLGVAAVGLAGVGLALAVAFGWLDLSLDRTTVDAWVARAGPWGPVLIVGLMIVAVVASPIPSAPVALVAGAAYGHVAGTIYVALGAEIGAVLAFVIARTLGRETVRRWIGEREEYGLIGSQNALTLAVFVSRLLPFVSFDAMSYAAGLSALHAWRFSLATLAGILPASFLLAHVGSAAVDGATQTGEWVALGLGLATALPLVVLALRRGRQRRSAPDDETPA